MKKIILSLTLILSVLILAACNSASAATDNSSQGSAANSNGNNPDAGERPQFNMPTEMTLMLGTVKLDETEYAVDAAQASQLLPLYKALLSLNDSEITAQAEIDGVISQIEDTMTPDQTSAIDAMNLTMQDMNSVMETLGIEGNFGGAGQMSEEMQATMEAARQSGDTSAGGPGGDFMPPDGGGGMGPGGGMGDGGGMGPGGDMGAGGAEMDPTARETAMAERGGAQAGGFGINTSLVESIIEFLSAKVQ